MQLLIYYISLLTCILTDEYTTILVLSMMLKFEELVIRVGSFKFIMPFQFSLFSLCDVYIKSKSYFWYLPYAEIVYQ